MKRVALLSLLLTLSTFTFAQSLPPHTGLGQSYLGSVVDYPTTYLNTSWETDGWYYGMPFLADSVGISPNGDPLTINGTSYLCPQSVAPPPSPCSSRINKGGVMHSFTVTVYPATTSDLQFYAAVWVEGGTLSAPLNCTIPASGTTCTGTGTLTYSDGYLLDLFIGPTHNDLDYIYWTAH